MITSYQMVTTHLWQSTLFAAAVGLLTLLLRKNSARIRYWVWLAVLVKFLIPFGVLVSLGGHLSMPGWARTVPLVVQPAISFLMGDMNEPVLPVLKNALPALQPTNINLQALLFGVWACGFVVIVLRWVQRWMRIRADVHAGSRLPIEIGIEVVSSPTLREPGVFGILHPVLLLPEGIAEHLSKAEWEAILAHELCHVRCHDNLTTAVYMLVESIFWFHPLVWWIGKRLVSERELACDEEVLRLGSEPKVYAEGILKVCELYLESPLECVAGVTGSNLRRRIRAIMTHGGTERMNMGRKLLLTVAGMTALAVPIGVGIINAPSLRAQSPQAKFGAAATPKLVLTALPAQESERFEVVSIKSHPEPIDFTDDQIHGVSYHAVGLTLLNLIEDAYTIGRFQISGGPNWLTSAHFDVEAKAGGSAPLTWERVLPMLQMMLADRFQLKVRTAMREVPCYDLVVAKGGSKLTENTDALPPGGVAARADANGGHIRAENGTTAKLARNLAGPAGRPVVDKTGLAGKYHIMLDYAADGSPDAVNGSIPTLFTALQDQLGLKLEPSRTTQEALVIESVEKPSGN